MSEEDERVDAIATWLSQVIGYGPIFEEMQAYAHMFYNLGWHSVECIIHEMRQEDLTLKEFALIKHFHKIRIGQALRTGY
jgi:hypothetical protein